VKSGQEVKILECDFHPSRCSCDCDCVGVRGRIEKMHTSHVAIVALPEGHHCYFEIGQLELQGDSPKEEKA
jgi:hypothetical protein